MILTKLVIKHIAKRFLTLKVVIKITIAIFLKSINPISYKIHALDAKAKT